MTNYPVEMYNYHSWANQTLLGHINNLPPNVLHQDLNSSSYRTIAHAFSHLYAVDTMWYMVLTGTSMREALAQTYAMNENVLESAESYAIKFAELSEQYKQWLSSQADLEQTIVLDNPYVGIRETRLSEIVLQVANHGTYHRGNVTTMLRQLGHASTMNDYALFWYQQEETVKSL